jgi:hypothetical protein
MSPPVLTSPVCCPQDASDIRTLLEAAPSPSCSSHAFPADFLLPSREDPDQLDD